MFPASWLWGTPCVFSSFTTCTSCAHPRAFHEKFPVISPIVLQWVPSHVLREFAVGHPHLFLLLYAMRLMCVSCYTYPCVPLNSIPRDHAWVVGELPSMLLLISLWVHHAPLVNFLVRFPFVSRAFHTFPIRSPIRHSARSSVHSMCVSLYIYNFSLCYFKIARCALVCRLGNHSTN